MHWWGIAPVVQRIEHIHTKDKAASSNLAGGTNPTEEEAVVA
jgi:hypothetical protein